MITKRHTETNHALLGVREIFRNITHITPQSWHSKFVAIPLCKHRFVALIFKKVSAIDENCRAAHQREPNVFTVMVRMTCCRINELRNHGATNIVFMDKVGYWEKYIWILFKETRRNDDDIGEFFVVRHCCCFCKK